MEWITVWMDVASFYVILIVILLCQHKSILVVTFQRKLSLLLSFQENKPHRLACLDLQVIKDELSVYTTVEYIFLSKILFHKV